MDRNLEKILFYTNWTCGKFHLSYEPMVAPEKRSVWSSVTHMKVSWDNNVDCITWCQGNVQKSPCTIISDLLLRATADLLIPKIPEEKQKILNPNKTLLIRLQSTWK